MKALIFAVISIFWILTFSNISFAAPSLHSPQPTNNSFVSGGSQTFSINVTSGNLNSSSALLHIISLNAYEQGENWDAYALTCVNTSNEWKCSKSISFVIAGSDTVELFYFEANDTDNTTGNSGTASNPLRFTLDRNPPIITFVGPVNNSYVKGNTTVSLTVIDTSSGVNKSTVQYSTAGSSWNMLQNISTSSFEAIWNTTTFSNNQTITLSARASDNVGNSLTARINVTVDNEIPKLVILSSLTGTQSGNAQLQANVSDTYSGIDLGNVRYVVGSLTGILGCAGSNYSATCSAVLNTVSLQDGNYTLTFSATDRAGNLNTSSIQITTKNTQPSISILEPTNNAFVKGTILIRTTVINAEVLNYADVTVEQGGNATTNNMTCNPSFISCNYPLDTNSFADGGYTIRARGMNSSDVVALSSIAVSIDNTKPSVTITQPTGNVKGDFEMKTDVSDANMNQNKVTFKLSSFNGSLTCTPQTPSTFICSTTFNSKQLSDGKYNLSISAEDKAGNIAITSKEINVANQQPTSQSTTGQTGTGSTPSGIGESGTSEVEKKTGGNFLGITLPFECKYLILGIVVTTVIVVVVILILVIIHKGGKTIITD